MSNPDHSDSTRPSLWLAKPWWCQPWSILLTGVVVIAASWFVFGRIWLTALAGLGITVWWFLFLVLVPAAYNRAENP